MFKRIAALLLALMMIVTLVGCGKKKREPIILTLSTEDAEAILHAAGIMLPAAEEVAAAGSKITYYFYYDDIRNYSEAEMIQTGYWTFREKYGCDVEWSECTWEDRFTKLAALLLSNDNPDFYPAWATDFPMYSLNDMFQPVDDYVDYDDPLWSDMKYYADKFFSIGKHHMMFVTDVEFNSIVVYNRRVMDEWGFDDPAEMFYNDDWTWDVMLEMAIDFTDPDAGRYAFNGWGTDSTFMTSTGVGIVERDPETGLFYSNIDDPRLERAANVLMEFAKNDCQFPHWTNGWKLNYDAEPGGMKEGMTLFGMNGNYIIEEGSLETNEQIFGDFRGEEVMICPVPRDPNGDGEYYIDSKPKGYCIIKGAPNPEGVALFASCCRFKVVDPTVINFDKRQLMEKGGWTQDMLDMWDAMYAIAHSHNTLVNFGGGLGKAGDPAGAMTSFNQYDNDSTWAQLKEENKERLEFYIDELNAEIEAFTAKYD